MSIIDEVKDEIRATVARHIAAGAWQDLCVFCIALGRRIASLSDDATRDGAHEAFVKMVQEVTASPGDTMLAVLRAMQGHFVLARFCGLLPPDYATRDGWCDPRIEPAQIGDIITFPSYDAGMRMLALYQNSGVTDGATYGLIGAHLVGLSTASHGAHGAVSAVESTG